jgi:ADP-ribose pyrophosphatase YjhB (NUDIX family)
MTRPRACGALIQNSMILMVRHVEPTRSYWTLPGGGLEANETPAESLRWVLTQKRRICLSLIGFSRA